MENGVLEKKIEDLLDDLRSYVESKSLTERDVSMLKAEIDRLLYECLYYKTKLIC